MRIGVVVVGLAVLLGVRTARAEGPETARPSRARDVAVRISGLERSVSLEVVASDTDDIVASCTGPCTFRAPRGRYVVYTTDAATGDRRQVGLRLRHDSHFYYRAGDSTAKTTGLVVGIVGPTLIFTGFLLVLPALFAGTCASDQGCSSEGKSNAARIGLGAMLVGAIATPIGWTTFASNRTKLIEQDTDAEARRGLQLRVGVARFGPDSLGLVGVGHF